MIYRRGPNKLSLLLGRHAFFRGAGMAQWWDGNHTSVSLLRTEFGVRLDLVTDCDTLTDTRTRRHMWLEFVFGSLLLLREVFLQVLQVFPSPQKPIFPNSNSILECTDISKRVLKLLGVHQWVNKLLLYFYFLLFVCFPHILAAKKPAKSWQTRSTDARDPQGPLRKKGKIVD